MSTRTGANRWFESQGIEIARRFHVRQVAAIPSANNHGAVSKHEIEIDEQRPFDRVLDEVRYNASQRRNDHIVTFTHSWSKYPGGINPVPIQQPQVASQNEDPPLPTQNSRRPRSERSQRETAAYM